MLRPSFLLQLLAAAAGCAGSRGDSRQDRAALDALERALAERDFALPDEGGFAPLQSDSGPGLYLAELDSRLRAWNALKASTRPADSAKLRAVEQELTLFTRQRGPELIEELQGGPPRHRRIAALGLGFTDDAAALGPLLAALDDTDREVVDNALAGLGRLADPETPLGPVLDQLRHAPDADTRRNAAYATLRVLTAGGEEPSAVEVCRLALYDGEPSVRVQAAACLGQLEDGEALPLLADCLDDEFDLVAVACGRAIVHIGTVVPEEQGEAARLLVEAAIEARGRRRELLRRELLRLSGTDRGPDLEEDWREWAHRLP